MEIPSLFSLCKNMISSALEKGPVMWDRIVSSGDQFLLDCAQAQAELGERQKFLLKLCQPSYIPLKTFVEQDYCDDDGDYEDDRFYEYEDDFAVVGNEFDNDFPEDDCYDSLSGYY